MFVEGRNFLMKKKSATSLNEIRAQLKKEIEDLQQSLETANSNFNNVSDPDLVDSCIYELNALTFRYKYLLRLVREYEAQAETAVSGPPPAPRHICKTDPGL